MRKPRQPHGRGRGLAAPAARGHRRSHAVPGSGVRVVGLGPALATAFKGNVGKTIHVAAVCFVHTWLAAEVSGGGGEVAPREVGFPRQWYPGLGGRHVAWDDSSLGGCRGSSCLFRGSGCRRHKCLFRSSSRVLWRHAGHLLDRSSRFSGALHVVWRAESMEAMRNDVPGRRRSAISQKDVVVVVGGSRWLGRSEPLRTHGVCVTIALFFERGFPHALGGDRLGLSPRCSRCFVVRPSIACRQGADLF